MRDAILVCIDTVGTTKTGTHLTTHTRLASLDHHSHTSRHRNSHSTHNTQRLTQKTTHNKSNTRLSAADAMHTIPLRRARNRPPS